MFTLSLLVYFTNFKDVSRKKWMGGGVGRRQFSSLHGQAVFNIVYWKDRGSTIYESVDLKISHKLCQMIL